MGGVRGQLDRRERARHEFSARSTLFGANSSANTHVSEMNSTIEHKPPALTPCDPAVPSTDEDLMLDYRERGDRRAFEQLVHRYERELYNYLRHYLGDAQMAEDAFQTTFLQVHLKCNQFEPGRKVRPWLYTVATNQAIDAQRRNRRHRMVSLDRRFGNDGGDSVASLVELIDSQEAEPLDHLRAAERHEAVRDAVDQLARRAETSRGVGLLPRIEVSRGGRGALDSGRNDQEPASRGRLPTQRTAYPYSASPLRT